MRKLRLALSGRFRRRFGDYPKSELSYPPTLGEHGNDVREHAGKQAGKQE